MTLRHSGLRTALLSFVCAALVVSAQAIGIPAANAVMPTPTGLAPDGSTEGTIPVLSWDRVTGATSYGVQVSTSPTFSPTLWSVSSTENRQAVPTVGLPAGTVYWRVQAKGAETSDWATASFTRSTVSGPTPLTPADGVSLPQPSQPPLLSWTPLSGVTGYAVEISQNPTFTDQVTSYPSIKTTNMVVPNPQVATTYYWRVRGVVGSGFFTEWSQIFDYQVQDLPSATRVAPATDDTIVDDAVLNWNPIKGAKTYQLQISTDENFNTLVHELTGITGTTYARPVTLNNDQYYWRVRAVGVTGVVQSWTGRPIWQFQRAWPDQPGLTYPADGATVGDPFYFQWTPATLADRYTLQLSTTSGFTGGTTSSCETVNTTFVANAGSHPCMPAASGTYYWRVFAHDGVVGTDQLAADERTFTYNPARVTLTSPANGGDFADGVPTLQWEALARAARYRVTITPTGGTPGGVITEVTAATSYTPRELLGGTYRWDVVTVSEDGRFGSALIPSSQRTFAVGTLAEAIASDPDSVSPLSGSFKRFPSLQWQPVVGATEYKVWIRKQGSAGGYTAIADTFPYPAGDDTTDTWLSPDTYQWFVEAYDDNGVLSQGNPGEFTIAEPSEVTGQRVGLTGTGVTTGETCSANLPSECQNLRHTPVLAWDADANVGSYRLTISRDREMTNKVLTTVVTSNRWIPSTAFADSQAGTAFFWDVQPCTSGDGCAALTYPNHAFNKLSNAVNTFGPGAVVADPQVEPIPEVQDDVTLTWEDYLLTNTNATQGSSAVATKATTEANRYRVQVSTVPNFQTLLDNVLVDQRQFTSYANTYPEGNVYWRVQATDGSGNALTWSPTRVFLKKSPVPTLLAPTTTGSDTVPGYTAFTWNALDYAASYDLEVYKDGDTQANTANRVVNAGSAQTALSLANPLPVSANPYVWRVRRVDATGRPGGWSLWGSFKVGAEPPGQTSPAPDAYVDPRESLFSWQPVAGASAYRFERRLVGTFTSAETVQTVATSYAPSKINAGDWEWRVSSLDTNNNVLMSSPWRTFTTALRPVATEPPSIVGSGAVDTQLTGFDPVWNMSEVTNTYQWMRGTSPISGANTLTYLVTTADLGKVITLRVTGSKPGYDNATTDSNGIMATAGAAPTTASPPSIAGSGQVASQLTATPPTWNETGVTESRQWLRDGAPISGQTGLTYTVVTADIGKSISWRVTGKKTGLADAVVVSNAIVGVAGPAPVATVAPSLTGTPTVGSTLKVAPGTWSGSPSLTYQWLRNGVPIAGATSTSYKVLPTDSTQQLGAVVTATKTGFQTASAATPNVTIAKMTSTTTASLAATQIKPGKAAKLTVTVTVTGEPLPTGKIVVRDGTKIVKTVTLSASREGVITIKIKKLKRGKHKLKASYSGTPTIVGSKAKKQVLRVAR